MKINKLLCLFIFFTLLPQISLANSKPGAITVTVGGGYMYFATKRDINNTVVPAAVAFTYNYDETWATSFGADLLNSNSNDPAKQHVHGFVYLLDEIYRVKSYRYVEPYLLGGINVISLKPIVNETTNQAGINLGVGAQFFKSNHVALSAEARDIYTFTGGKNDILLNIGVNFIWE